MAVEMAQEAVSATVDVIGSTMADQIVDGTADWEEAGKGMLKMLIKMAIQLAIMAALAAVVTAATGGASTAAGGAAGGGGGLAKILGFHTGGIIPKHHNGVLSRDEHLAVLQEGEGVIQQSSMKKLGKAGFNEINDTGTLSGGGSSLSVVLNYQGSGSQQDASKMVDMVWEGFQTKMNRGYKLQGAIT